ncbi:MAG: hypothetical protein GY789_11530 [Hyphomicrobiales bacterium]|nr:hypothetical protein [Hyphomicrobiales bacterium]MCP5002225.1 hypothetical protein [Hyphomicrobiales bacterium]
MKAFETAIRKALQKVDYANPKLRERIYQSARDALNNSQAKQGVWGSDTASTQTRRLEELIESIEVEYRQEELPPRTPKPERRKPEPAPEPKQSPPPIRADPPPMREEPQSSERLQSENVRWTEAAPTPVEADLRAERITSPEPRPKAKKKAGGRGTSGKKADPDLLGADKAKGGRKKKEKKRRRPVFSLILVGSLVIAFVGIGILWAVFNGLFLSPEQRDTSVPNPPAAVDGGDFAGNPAAEGSFSGDWLEIFTPDDISRVARRGGAKAALIESSGRPALQIVSPDPGAESEVLFELSPDVLQSLAGRKSLVAMTLRASSDTPTQIYVKCMLPAEDNCGRHRFDVNYEIGDVVFSLDLTGRFAGGEPGYLALNSDVTGTGHGVDVYAIRIRPQ